MSHLSPGLLREILQYDGEACYRELIATGRLANDGGLEVDTRSPAWIRWKDKHRPARPNYLSPATLRRYRDRVSRETFAELLAAATAGNETDGISFDPARYWPWHRRHFRALRGADPTPADVVIEHRQGGGDAVCLSGAIRDLHAAHPNRFRVWCKGGICPEIFANNPRVGVDRFPETDYHLLRLEVYPGDYPTGGHLQDQFRAKLAAKLRVPIPRTILAGEIHLSEAERNAPPPSSRPIVALFPHGKSDFTTKWIPRPTWQAIIDAFRDRVDFLRVGGADCYQPQLAGVIDTGRKMNLRQVIQAVYWSDAVISLVSFGMHLAPAVPVAPGKLAPRPCIVLAGGREDPQLYSYPGHRILQTIGAYECCKAGPCWRFKAHVAPHDRGAYPRPDCEQPVLVTGEAPHFARCMAEIRPEQVIRLLEPIVSKIIAHRAAEAWRQAFFAAAVSRHAAICHRCPAMLEQLAPAVVKCAAAPESCACNQRVQLTGRCPEGRFDTDAEMNEAKR